MVLRNSNGVVTSKVPAIPHPTISFINGLARERNCGICYSTTGDLDNSEPSCIIQNPPSEFLEERLQRLGGLLQLLIEGGVRPLLTFCFLLHMATKRQ